MTPDTPMTQDDILDLGWEMLKLHERPQTCLWLASEGWERGHVVTAERGTPGRIMVDVKAWEFATISRDMNPN